VAIRSGTHKPRNEYGWIWAAMRDALDDMEAAVNEQARVIIPAVDKL
jgi:hypothetical protein